MVWLLTQQLQCALFSLIYVKSDHNGTVLRNHFIFQQTINSKMFVSKFQQTEDGSSTMYLCTFSQCIDILVMLSAFFRVFKMAGILYFLQYLAFLIVFK